MPLWSLPYLVVASSHAFIDHQTLTSHQPNVSLSVPGQGGDGDWVYFLHVQMRFIDALDEQQDLAVRNLAMHFLTPGH